MTRLDRIRIFELRHDGMTLEEIGNVYGISRERVRQIMEEVTHGYDRKMRCSYMQKCIYPGIKKWLLDNRITASELNKKCGLCEKPTLMYNRIMGVTEFKISEIQKILAYTGMTFEEAFGGGEQA